MTKDSSDDQDPNWRARSLAALDELERRWWFGQAPADLDAVVAGYADLVMRDPDMPSSWFGYGKVLLARADANKNTSVDTTDLDKSIAALRRAIDAVAPDPDFDAVACWQAMALAYYQRWQHTRNTVDRDQLVTCVDVGESAAGGECDADQQLLRLAALGQQIDGRYDPEALRIRGRIRGLLDRVYTALGPQPECDAEAARSALGCADLEISTFVVAPRNVDHQRVDRWLNIAMRHPAPPPGWADKIRLLSGICAGYEKMVTSSSGLDGIEDMLAALRGPTFSRHPDLRAAGMSMIQAISFLTAAAGVRRGDIGMAAESAALLAEVTDGSGQEDSAIAMFATVTELMPAIDNGDEAAVASLISRITEIVRNSPTADSDRSVLAWVKPFMSLIAKTRGQQTVLPSADDDAWSRPAHAVARSAALVHEAVLANDANGLRAAIRELTPAEENAGPDFGAALMATHLLSYACTTLAIWQPRDSKAVEAAVHWNTIAMERWQTPIRPMRSTAQRRLAVSLRLRGRAGDVRRGRELALSALHDDTLRVLLQSATDHAAVAARSAAGHAVRLAEWCVADLGTDPDAERDLIRALEAGRGLVLRAAVVSRTVTQQLTALGHPDLAAEWEKAGGGDWLNTDGVAGLRDIRLPGDLRNRVIQTLTTDVDSSANPQRTVGLFDAPSVDEITEVLTMTETDVLAYLVPDAGQGGGMAVLVSSSGAIEILPLPELTVAAGTQLSTYTQAYQEWKAADTNIRPRKNMAWQVQLDLLCGWAWRVAGAQLLAAARRLADGRHGGMPRLALVPFGMLALVPWHSAWRTEDIGAATADIDKTTAGVGAATAGKRYLVQDAMISVVPSAQMLCEAATRERLTDGDVLVVGNPTDDLRWAWLEADGICGSLYRDATCFGVEGQMRSPGRPSPNGRGTPAEVLDWLDKHETTPRRLLHLACHAQANPSHAGRSSVSLAGGNLSIATLLDRWPTSRLRLGTAVLSSCTTDVSAYNYDEAFSIATTFLALGARNAIGSLWNIQDAHTSIFMFMFHHHLTTRYPGEPAAALHATRLWMLNRDRRIPDTMPEILARNAAALPLDAPAYWAAFNHVGA